MRGLALSSGELLRRYSFLLKATAIGIAVLAFVLVVHAIPMEHPVRRMREWVDHLGIWAPVVFIGVFIGLTTIMLPGWPLNVAAGTLFGPFWGGVAASVASTSAAAVSFLIARYLARAKVADLIEHYPKLHAVYDSLGKERGWKVVAAVRLSHSLPFGLQNFLLGVSPVRLGPYLLATWLVTLPGIFFVAYLGYLGGVAVTEGQTAEPTSVWTWVARGIGLAVAGGAVYYLGRTVFRAINEHKQTREPKRAPQEDADARNGWPWGSVAALLGALLFLGFALWCQTQKEWIREMVEDALASKQVSHEMHRPC